MKCKLLSTLLFFLCCNAFSQDKRVFLDSLHYETSGADYKYVRIVKGYYESKKIYLFSDYYKSGAIEMTGTSKSKDRLSYDGQFVYYYENGNKKESVYYGEHSRTGAYAMWYENGNPKLEGEYLPVVNIPNTEKKQPDLKILEYWDNDNIHKVTLGNGDYEETTIDEFSSGKIKDGFKDGIWTGCSDTFNYTYSEIYENQKLVSGVSIDLNQVEHLYTIADIRADTPKGIDDFRWHIAKNFQMPEDEDFKGGTILGSFEIGIDGDVTDFRILREIGYGTGKEMIKAFRSYAGKWRPRELRGIKVKSTFRMPINLQSAR